MLRKFFKNATIILPWRLMQKRRDGRIDLHIKNEVCGVGSWESSRKKNRVVCLEWSLCGLICQNKLRKVSLELKAVNYCRNTLRKESNIPRNLTTGGRLYCIEVKVISNCWMQSCCIKWSYLFKSTNQYMKQQQQQQQLLLLLLLCENLLCTSCRLLHF